MHPFNYGTVVYNATFVNREADKKRLLQNFNSGINSVLISPRRWGKSSLVKESGRLFEAENKNNRVCFIDMFSIRSEEEFYTTLAKNIIKCTSAKWEDWVKNGKEFFKQIIPKFSMGNDDENSFSLSLDWEEAKKYKDEILNLPENIATQKGLKIVVCIDEFQNLKTFRDADSFEKILRSHWQHHNHVSYCLYGSKRHMMENIFNKKTSAFYRFGDVMLLQKIEQQHWTPFLINAFTKQGVKINTEIAELISSKVQCHPYYLQQLAHTIWTIEDTEITEQVVNRAFEDMMNTNAMFYQKEAESLNNTQIQLLKAIAKGHSYLTSTATMRQFNIGTPRNVSKNKHALEYLDIIDIANKKINFLDPVFEAWFCQQFLTL